MAFKKEDIEKLLSEKYTLIKPPKQIYILDAPIVYPELKAKILGLNQAFERSTIILASDATEETLAHESLHGMGFGEIITKPLAKWITKLRSKFPPIFKREVVYEEQELTSDEIKRFGLVPYPKCKYKVRLLKLKKVVRRLKNERS
ncbi:MAG: hypothetical protein ACTSSP_12445 [Candidatus Asgardarchaeia archaeon]